MHFLDSFGISRDMIDRYWISMISMYLIKGLLFPCCFESKKIKEVFNEGVLLTLAVWKVLNVLQVKIGWAIVSYWKQGTV